MGLRGPVKKPRWLEEVQGNPGRRPEKPEPGHEPKITAQIKRLYVKSKRLGDLHYKIALREAKAGQKPSPHLNAALNCWKTALQAVYRTGRIAEPPVVNEDPFDAYKKAKHRAS